MSGLLVVCTANVCRSPLAQRVFQRGLAGLLDPGAISSAGIAGEDGRPMCAVSAAALPDPDEGSAHRSRPVDEAQVRGADLVLAMEREQRSFLSRLAPGSQAKVFTLLEAEGLLAVLAERGGHPATLADLAGALHSVRGFVPVPPPPPRRWWRRPPPVVDPLTLTDGPGLAEDRHAASVEAVRAAADRVAAGIRAALAG